MKDFIPHNEALALKELGFDEPCLAKYAIYNPKDPIALFPQSQDFFKGYFNYCKNSDYTDKTAAPLYQQAFRWLYQKLDIEKGIMPLDAESQQLLLKELIDKVSSKHLLV